MACIGPAGERGVLFASIMNGGDRAAGRSGVGAVMGSKNLKAVAVKGNTPVPLFDATEFKERVKEFNRKFSGLRKYIFYHEVHEEHEIKLKKNSSCPSCSSWFTSYLYVLIDHRLQLSQLQNQAAD